ncbi:MAG: hypothetical protein CYPHOPRED_004001 [Cyphobasidiales sp. Tagirdzhanova-0007]|nr:MAG: hypothetical protein CYPHOPRED_004001 [Cyphobasidiales sp. Tagirdzhanova-0007]
MSSRVQQLLKLRTSIFQTSYNPTNTRTGSKYLKAALRGPAMVAYYPQRLPKISALNKLHPDLGAVDIYENQRLADLEARRKRGKGPPKKGQGRRSTMKKK